MKSRKSQEAKDILIGEDATVTDAKNPTLNSIQGKIIDETKNTIIIETKNGNKTIIKSQMTIEIRNKKIKGTSLIGRIEARIKQ